MNKTKKQKGLEKKIVQIIALGVLGGTIAYAVTKEVGIAEYALYGVCTALIIFGGYLSLVFYYSFLKERKLLKNSPFGNEYKNTSFKKKSVFKKGVFLITDINGADDLREARHLEALKFITKYDLDLKIPETELQEEVNSLNSEVETYKETTNKLENKVSEEIKEKAKVIENYKEKEKYLEDNKLVKIDFSYQVPNKGLLKVSFMGSNKYAKDPLQELYNKYSARKAQEILYKMVDKPEKLNIDFFERVLGADLDE